MFQHDPNNRNQIYEDYVVPACLGFLAFLMVVKTITTVAVLLGY